MYTSITKIRSPYEQILEPLIISYQYLQYVLMHCISFYNMQQLTYLLVPFYLSYAIMYQKCHVHTCVFNLSEEIQNHSD